MAPDDARNDDNMSAQDAFFDGSQGDYRHNTEKSSKDLEQRGKKPTQRQYKPM